MSITALSLIKNIELENDRLRKELSNSIKNFNYETRTFYKEIQAVCR